MDVLSVEHDGASRDATAVHADQPADRAQQGGLPRTVGSEQCDDLSGRHHEVDAVQHRQRIAVGDFESRDLQRRTGAPIGDDGRAVLPFDFDLRLVVHSSLGVDGLTAGA